MGKSECRAEVFKDTSKVEQEIHLGDLLGSCPDSSGTQRLRAPVRGREGLHYSHFSDQISQNTLKLFKK